MFSCRLCGSSDFAPEISLKDWLAFAATAAGPGEVRKRMATLVASHPELDFGSVGKCGACGLRTVERPPDSGALGALYEDYWASSNYAGKREKKIARSRRRIARLKGSAPGRRFLDIGANLGFTVEAARLESLDAAGIEIDEKAVAAARGLFPDCKFRCMSAEELSGEGAKFDFLYCSEVLEHAPDFQRLAAALGALAAPMSVLYLTTPDAGHWARPNPFYTWDEVKPPEHIQWFEQRHLRDLFRAHGFHVAFDFALKPGIRMVARKLA